MRNLKKYGFYFEDPECGPDVPCIIEVYANSFDEACRKRRDLLLLADRAKEEGEPIYRKMKRYR
ncbi:hypothetical protein [Acetobacterium wieringae]|uniref:hypothetical protein n=1 Tax=Acetobacterium wieringae TaxID=52694 RepID=UPI001D7AC49F|nr:hypothetical protein [Acetobacterium wieringae]VUZ27419.1 Uncharacterised protein [Acetobacterium wieringae]